MKVRRKKENGVPSIDPKKADSSQAYDQLEKDNTVTPITDFYDYGADNKTPNSIRYRVWATNTTAKGNSTEIPGLDDSGVYYNELNYVDVLSGGTPDTAYLDSDPVYPKDHQR